MQSQSAEITAGFGHNLSSREAEGGLAVLLGDVQPGALLTMAAPSSYFTP